MNPVDQVLEFWFAGRRRFRPEWFVPDDAVDRAVADALLEHHHAAADGRLDDLATYPEGALTLCILLDQVPRNVFRGTARAFATDAAALAFARRAVALEYDRRLHWVERLFLYLPFEHSERMSDQQRSVELFRGLGDPMSLDYAVRHRDIIAAFGRFPHRNDALGRSTTTEEAAFLTQPRSRF